MIVIIDYKMGNVGSVLNIIKKVGGKAIVSSDKSIIEKADKLILPGVGNFSKAMTNLKQLDLIDILNKRVLHDKIPVLGICLGMQLMTNKSEEGGVSGLGWIDAEVKRFSFKLEEELKLKVPHMGWNNVQIENNSNITSGLMLNARFYFVHSYFVECTSKENILFSTNHGIEFASGIVNQNIIGVQFHPEKSHKFGMLLIENFLTKC
jgi:imidazole glycerol-phosphate synthase subunit HisH